MSDERESSARLGRALLAAAVVLIATFATHRGALANDFVDWDDDINLYANPNLVTSEIRWGLPWREPYQGLWIPVTYTTWAAIAAATRVEVATGRYDLVPGPYHAANLALHAGSALLVFVVLLRWLPEAGRRRRELAAMLGALLFALHPIQVEVVHWATALKDALSTFLALACFALVPRAPERFRLAMPVAWLLFSLALASKPGVVVLPVVWLLFAVARDGWPRAAGWMHAGALLLLGVGAAVVGRLAQPATTGAGEAAGVGERVLVALDSLGFYLAQLVAPRGYCPDYGRTPGWVVEQGAMTTTVALGAGFAALVLLLAGMRKWRAALVLAVIPAAVGPVLGLIEFSHQRFSTVTDRYFYLAMLAPAAVLALVVARPRLGRLWPVALVALAFLAGRSVGQGRHWRDGRAMWENVLAVNPRSGTAWSNLGYQLDREGRWQEAIEHYERAAALDPTNALALNNIGNVHYRAGRWEEARAAYERARRANPKDLNARNNLGAIHRVHGETEAAEALFRAVVETNPNFAPAHHNLGLVALDRGDLAAAEASLEEALRIDPGFAAAHRSMTRVTGRDPARDDETREHLALATGIDPESSRFALEWVRTLRGAGRPDDDLLAAQLAAWERGVRDPTMLLDLGRRLARRDDLARAEEVLRATIEAAPDALEPRVELAAFLERVGRWSELRDLMTRAVAEFPFAPAPWHYLAVYHLRTGDEEKARGAVDTALRLQPDFAPSRVLARELGASGRSR